jgi:hypothetical protein
MSTIKVTNLQDTSGANSSTSEEIFQGRAKAWVTFDGSFGSSPFTEANGGIRDSFNITSITDNGTGLYTVNFTNAMPNANYTVVLGGSRDLPEISRCFPANVDQIGTSSFDLTTHNDGSTEVDWELVTFAVLGA